MSTDQPDSSEKQREPCIFCLIATGQDKDAEVIKKNKELVCFRDIYPAAPHHYLVVPRQHIHSCFALHRGHIGLIKRMAEMGKAALHDQGITDMKDIRLGFHQPPFTSVDHLHLHVLAPGSQISMYMVYKFIPGTNRFITPALRIAHIRGANVVSACIKLEHRGDLAAFFSLLEECLRRCLKDKPPPGGHSDRCMMSL